MTLAPPLTIRGRSSARTEVKNAQSPTSVDHVSMFSFSPSHSRSWRLPGRVPDSLSDGVSRASRLMSTDGVSSNEDESATKPSAGRSAGSWGLRVTLRVGATRRFLAPPSAAPGRDRLMGGAESSKGGVKYRRVRINIIKGRHHEARSNVQVPKTKMAALVFHINKQLPVSPATSHLLPGCLPNSHREA